MSARPSPSQKSPPHPNGKLPAGLYLIATPIGNLGDLTIRAQRILGELDLLLCEDTRVTGKLLAAYGLAPRTESYHEHNAAKMEARILERIAEGQAIGLVSDAGTPIISDPGEQLAKAARQAGLMVTALPGANAVLTALCLSGLPSTRFFFAGFMPPKAAARRQELATLAAIPSTLIFYESPNRVAEALADMLTTLGNRPAAVARELTKLYEEVRQGNLADLAAHYAEVGAPRGEIVIVVGAPAAEQDATDADVDAALIQELATTTLRDAAAIVAARTGRAKRDVYARALSLSKK